MGKSASCSWAVVGHNELNKTASANSVCFHKRFLRSSRNKVNRVCVGISES
jgi:hypothetical protein